MAALNVADLVETPDDYRLRFSRSKTDQEGAGQEVAIWHGRHLKPVQAVKDWLAIAPINVSPLFCRSPAPAACWRRG